MNTNKNATRGGVQTSKKLLAALAVMAVAFVVLAAVPSVATDSDAVETTPVDVDSIDKLTGNTAGTYKLKADLEITSSIEISAKITLDLNGYKITATGVHTIVVKSTGDLTVIDSSTDADKKGAVDVKNTGYGALFIETGGKATLNGGLFERSGETATKIDGKEPANKDSWYTIKNLGTLTINEGAVVKNYVPGAGVDVTKITGASSNICNGGDGATSPATLVINGGAIDGGLNAVKNDEYGVLTIKAGTITNQIQVAVMNWGEATIDGGSFTGYQSALWVCSWKDDDSSTASAGKLTVNGGIFTNTNGQPDLVVQTNSIYNTASKTYADQPVAVILGKAVELTVKCNNTEAGFVLSEGSSLEFVKDSVLPKIVSYTKDSKISSVEFSNATVGDVVKISAGSIDISGQINAATSGTITVTGDAVISESAILSKDVTLTIESGATLTVKNGATLTVADGATVTDSNTEAKFVNNGTVVVKGTVDKIDNKKTVRLYGTISGGTNNGTIVVMDKDAVVENIAGSGSIDVSEVTETKKISGSISKGYTQSPSFQTVIVFEDLVIKEGALMDVYGTFVINEGVKVTIEAGAALRLNGSMAKLVNNGTIVVNGGTAVSIESNSTDAALDVDAYASVENNGSIQLDYVLPSAATDGTVGASMHVAENAIVSNAGEIVVGEASKLDVGGKLVSSGTLSVKGQLDGAVSTSGIVEFDSVLNQTATVSLTSVEASVTFVKVVSTSGVTVNDIGFKYKVTASAEATEISSENAQSVVVSYTQPAGDSSAYLGGLTVAIGTFVENNSSVKTTLTELVLSGSLVRSVTGSDPASDVPKGTVAIVGPVEVKESLTVGTHVDVSVDGEFKVAGTAVFGQNAVLKSKGSDDAEKGTLVATGEVTSAVDFLNSSQITNKIDFIGATYKVEVQATATASSSVTYHYAGIAAAIDAAAMASVKAVNIYAAADGSSLTEDATVVKDMTVTLDQGRLVIDSGKTLEVADGGVLKSGTATPAPVVKVDGKLVFDVAKTGKKVADDYIDAEVVSTADKSETYSSLVTALADAGSETTVIKLRSNATIKADTAIQSNVTVQTEGKSITVDKEKTLTVDGTVYLNTGSIVLGEKAKVVLNGYIKSDNSYVYETNDNEIDGAYYTTDDQTYYWATGIANAPAVTSKADAAVKIFGDVTTALDFVGTADDLAVVEITAKKISAPISGTYTKIAVKTGTVTGAFALADSEVVFENGVILGTSVKAGDNSVAMKDLVSSVAKFVAVAKDGAQTLSVTGTIVASLAEDAAPSISFTGDVTVVDFTAKVKAVVDGNLTVSKNVTGNVALGDVVVTGTVLIDNAATLTVDDMEIEGTVTVAAKTDTKAAGALEAEKIFLGTTEKSVLGAEPAVVASDKIDFVVMYVAPGASVSDAAVKDVEKTIYTVENAVVLTAYGNAKIADYQYKVVDAKFGGWYNGTTKVENQMIGEFDTVAAKMDYEVYTIEIVGDAGVGTVSVNGIILDKESNSFYTRSEVKAGTYKVTFTAVSGYDTSALKLTDASGKDLSMEIVLSGDFSEANKNIYYLSGSVPAVTPTPDPTPIIIKDEDDGMSLTDILLIVLVVLIVIMAAIVALRMMRS